RRLTARDSANTTIVHEVLARATISSYTTYTFVSRYGADTHDASLIQTADPTRRFEAAAAADPARRHGGVPQHGHHADGGRRRRRPRGARAAARQRVSRGGRRGRGVREDPPPRRRPRGCALGRASRDD